MELGGSVSVLRAQGLGFHLRFCEEGPTWTVITTTVKWSSNFELASFGKDYKLWLGPQST